MLETRTIDDFRGRIGETLETTAETRVLTLTFTSVASPAARGAGAVAGP